MRPFQPATQQQQSEERNRLAERLYANLSTRVAERDRREAIHDSHKPGTTEHEEATRNLLKANDDEFQAIEELKRNHFHVPGR